MHNLSHYFLLYDYNINFNDFQIITTILTMLTLMKKPFIVLPGLIIIARNASFRTRYKH